MESRQTPVLQDHKLTEGAVEHKAGLVLSINLRMRASPDCVRRQTYRQ